LSGHRFSPLRWITLSRFSVEFGRPPGSRPARGPRVPFAPDAVGVVSVVGDPQPGGIAESVHERIGDLEPVGLEEDMKDAYKVVLRDSPVCSAFGWRWLSAAMAGSSCLRLLLSSCCCSSGADKRFPGGPRRRPDCSWSKRCWCTSLSSWSGGHHIPSCHLAFFELG
jgi:hypothetical protein